MRHVANPWLLVLVPLAVVAAFFWFGVVQILWTSFSSPELGLTNYRAFLSSPAEMAVLWRTFGISASVTVVCLILGYPYAYLLATSSGWTKVGLLIIVLIPFWTSMMVRTYAWVVLLQDNGVIDQFLEWIGLEQVELMGNPSGILIGMSQILLPFMITSLYANMIRIDRRLLDAASSLGAFPAVAFVKIYIPLTMPGIAAGCTLVFVMSLGFYLAPVLLGSPMNAMLSQVIVQQVSQFIDFGRAGAMAGVLLALALTAVALGALAAHPAIVRGYGPGSEG